ncbi:MAG: DUF5119 domain-containing protein [Prevotella sp.]|nr:DUF5119 domain-containing protein [Prevotella sp.]
MTKKRYILIGMWAVAMMAFTSCKRMPLYDMEKSVELELSLVLDLDLELDLDVDVDVDIEKKINAPDHMKVLFYEPSDRHLQYTEFVDGTGGKISTPPGSYRMLVYSFGTEYTQIRGDGDIATIEAFTSDITATKGSVLRGFTRSDADMPSGPVIYMPDHLLVAAEDVTIPDWMGEEIRITLHATASTIVETYTFEVHSVIGAEYIESCEAFVTNQARSSFFGLGVVSSEPATLWFPVGVDRRKGCLYTTFNTFGKLPGASHSYLHILVRDTGGQEHHYSTDITEQFEKTDKHIIIDEKIDIPEPPSHGGGIAPTVHPWDEESHDIPIG